MTDLPMFPLGSVLFPHMPLQLRVFEERYLIMMSRILDGPDPEFGVVLIERGQEVGGGEKRFRHGTVARVTQLSADEAFIGLVAVGDRRFEVAEWLDEDPHPQADIRYLPDLEWTDEHAPLLAQAERVVRRALAMASEFSEGVWPADVEVSDDPSEAMWQLAAIAPIGALDQVALLRSSSVDELLTAVITATNEAEEALTPWNDAIDDEIGDAIGDRIGDGATGGEVLGGEVRSDGDGDGEGIDGTGVEGRGDDGTAEDGLAEDGTAGDGTGGDGTGGDDGAGDGPRR